MKKALICLSIIAILTLCVPNIAVASTGNYPTTIYNNARHTDDYISITRGSNSNGILLERYTTKSIGEPTAASNGIVYIGGGGHNVYALNADTGNLVWNYTTGFDVYSSPAVANGIVYVGSCGTALNHSVYALDARTGTEIWIYTTGDSVTPPALAGGVTSPAVANGIVYVGSDYTKVYALNANTGAMVWEYTTGGEVNSSPAIADSIV
ncbi:MAG: PQQ-binding-like beta-propeller repeat protein [Halobacteriota archaeon]